MLTYSFNSSPPIMPHICVGESGPHWFQWRHVAYSAPSHYLNQSWVIVNRALRNKLQWNLNQNGGHFVQGGDQLIHWGHICVSRLTIIGSDNGLSPGRRQAIIWTNAGILLIRPLETNFNEMLIEILAFSFMKMRLKVSSAKLRPFCLGLNALRDVCEWFTYRAYVVIIGL